MIVYAFSELPSCIDVAGDFDESCELKISEMSLLSIKDGKLKLVIRKPGKKGKVSNFKLSIESLSGKITIYVTGNNSSVNFAPMSKGNYDFRLWGKSHISIGAKTTANSIKVVCDNSSFICGEDCMFSTDVLIQAADQHGIVDIKTGGIVNNEYTSVVLGDHVWLGRQCTLTAKASVGSGSVIGTASTVTSEIPRNTVAAGVPARVIKENHTWSRSPTSLDDYSKKVIQLSSYL